MLCAPSIWSVWHSMAQQKINPVLCSSPPSRPWPYSLTCCPGFGPRSMSAARQPQPQKQLSRASAVACGSPSGARALWVSKPAGEAATPLETCSWKGSCHSKCPRRLLPSCPGTPTKPSRPMLLTSSLLSPPRCPSNTRAISKQAFARVTSKYVPCPEWEHFDCTALQAKAMRTSGAKL